MIHLRRPIHPAAAPTYAMCHAPAIPFIMIGMMVAATAASAIGSIAQGQAANATAQHNADLASQAAQMEGQQGQIAWARKQQEGRIARGNSLVALSGSGVDPSEGSPLDLLSAQAKEFEFQANEAKFSHDLKAWQLQTGANDQRAQGVAALNSGYANALLSGLTGTAVTAFKGADLLKTSADTTTSAGSAAPGMVGASRMPGGVT